MSSSAAVETASMHAAAPRSGSRSSRATSRCCARRAENLVAGAPCGVMDQMTCVFGERDALLALLCQPAELQPSVPVPDDIEFWGLDSGERHAVGGSDYGAVRTGAFMGLRILSEHARRAGRTIWPTSRPRSSSASCCAVCRRRCRATSSSPATAAPADTVTTVEPGRRYRVRAPTAHPVYERQRAETFRHLLRARAGRGRRVRLGELMYESHASYGRCGLGSPGTDRLVELVRAEGPAAGLYGARITGGGSGGTVAVIGRQDAGAAIARVADAYERATGYRPHVFCGVVARRGGVRQPSITRALDFRWRRN